MNAHSSEGDITMTDHEIYMEFRHNLDGLSVNELAELEATLDSDLGFRREAGREFAWAVHSARDNVVSYVV